MKIIMNTTRIVSIDEIEKFLQGTTKINFLVNSKKERYQFISETLVRFKYLEVRKKDKTLIKKYLQKVTGYSRKQIKRLIKKWKKGKLLASLEIIKNSRHSFPYKYGPVEIGLLVRADKALHFPNGHTLKRSLSRECKVFNKFEGCFRSLSSGRRKVESFYH